MKREGHLNPYSAYSDDSGCFAEAYQSICVVSGITDKLERLREELAQILIRNRVKEVKFEKVRTHCPKVKAAQEFADKAIENILAQYIKIDVLCWWLGDSRHNIYGRDDPANLARMYYKVLRNICEKWRNHDWTIYPDMGSKLDWGEVVDYLNNTRLIRKPFLMTLFQQDNFFINVRGVTPRDSIKEPLVQLADLFAGLACFSIDKRDLCTQWMRQKNYLSHPGLFCDHPETVIKPTDHNRFDLLYRVYTHAKKYELGVSLEQGGYIRSFSKNVPLNFWHYHPMNAEDKAPTRRRR